MVSFSPLRASDLWLSTCAKHEGRDTTSVLYICNETANSSSRIFRVPQRQYLRRSDGAIGEMPYFYIEHYMQLSRYSGGRIGLDLQANKECETVISDRPKADDLEFLFFSVLSRDNRSLRGHC